MYKIIGADQKEYGPVSLEQMRQWFSERRVNGQTSVWSEAGGEWKPLAAYAEFADLVAAMPPTAVAPAAYAPAGVLPPDMLSRDYDLDIGRCISQAWELLTNNFGMVFGGAAIFLLIQAGLGGLAQIPFIGLLFSLASLVVSGPLMGGLYYFLLKNIRRQPVEISDIFAGFRMCFGQLCLGYIVVAILTGLSMLPGGVIVAVPIIWMVHHNAAAAGPILVAMVGLIIAMIPAVYLSVSWIFSLPLIIDKQMEFWPAMGASRKMVGKHFWLVFGLLVVCGLIYLAGFLVCCVGLFFALPLILGAMMYGYESIFSAPAGGSA
jgi:uncharacterized membrane protein